VGEAFPLLACVEKYEEMVRPSLILHPTVMMEISSMGMDVAQAVLLRQAGVDLVAVQHLLINEVLYVVMES